MLSRVKTRYGLYARKHFSEDISKYAVQKSLIYMLNKFSHLTPSSFSDDEYVRFSESAFQRLNYSIEAFEYF